MAKVGIIAQSFAVDGNVFAGGAEQHTYHLARLATDAGADVTVYQPASTGDVTSIEGVRVRSVATDQRGIWRAATRLAVADGCERFHYQYLAHVPGSASRLHASATHHGIYWDVPFDSRYAAWYPHGRLARLYLRPWRIIHKRRYLKALRRCREVLAADTSLLRLVQSDLPNLRDRIVVVPNFSDLSPTAKHVGADRDYVIDEIEAAKRDGRLVVLIPRNLSLKQGIAFLPELVQIVEQRTAQRCQFVVTGQFIRTLPQSAHYERQLNRAVAALPPESRARLTFLHGVKHECMWYCYQAADIVVIPSFSGEATSLAAIEGMIFGRPVVATNIGGLNDVIEDGHNGMLVRARVDELADAITKLALDDGLRRRLGDAAQCTAKRRYSLEAWKSLVLPFIDRNEWLPSSR